MDRRGSQAEAQPEEVALRVGQVLQQALPAPAASWLAVLHRMAAGPGARRVGPAVAGRAPCWRVVATDVRGVQRVVAARAQAAAPCTSAAPAAAAGRRPGAEPAAAVPAAAAGRRRGAEPAAAVPAAGRRPGAEPAEAASAASAAAVPVRARQWPAPQRPQAQGVRTPAHLRRARRPSRRRSRALERSPCPRSPPGADRESSPRRGPPRRASARRRG